MPLDALDYEKIRQLLIEYCMCLDFGDISGYVECFVPDGLFEIMQPPNLNGLHVYKGHDQLRAFAANHWAISEGKRGRHHIVNSRIKPDGDGARVVSYHLSTKDGGMPAKGERVSATVHSTGLYFDRLVRVGDGWRISERRFRYNPQPEKFDRWTGMPK